MNFPIISSKARITAAALGLIFSSASFALSQNLLSNGSFGMETRLENVATMRQYDLPGKGFELDFDGDRWAAGWVINGAMAAAKISFIENDDGTRVLRVDSRGESHLYPEGTLPSGEAYRGSFYAKGEGNENPPKVFVYAYYYSNLGWVENVRIQTFDLTGEWARYEFEVPPESPEGAINVRIAYGFSGVCEFKNVEITQAD